MKNGRAIVLTRKLHGQTDDRQTDRHYDYNTPLCRGVKIKKQKLKRMRIWPNQKHFMTTYAVKQFTMIYKGTEAVERSFKTTNV